MKRLSHKFLFAVPVVMIGGTALVGSLLWAANPHGNQAPKPEASPPQLVLNAQPIHRDGRMAASFAPVVKKVVPSVVKVFTKTKARFASQEEAIPPELNTPSLRRFFGDQFQRNTPDGAMRMPPQEGTGSGVIVSKDGYILTNNHVVDHADEVKVTLHDGRQFTAKVIGRDPKSDLAVVKVEANNLPAIEIADSDQVEVGDLVLAVGNPFGLGETVTMGMVSAIGRATLGLDYEDFIQTDAAINPGNSGGALVDAEGRLIGINTAILSHSGGNQGIGFAIPVDLARHVMDNLVSYGRVIRGYLGVTIQDITPALAKEFKLSNDQGALVSEVVPNSPASKAGLADGDVVTEFNGKNVTDSRRLKLQVAEIKPGTSVPVKVMRSGEARTLTIKMGELPGEQTILNASHQPAENSDALHGVGVTDLSSQARRDLRVPNKIQGALIESVAEDSAAAKAGLKPGDVILEINRQKVTNSTDAVRLTEHPKDKVTLVRVWSNGGTHYVAVDESKDKAA